MPFIPARQGRFVPSPGTSAPPAPAQSAATPAPADPPDGREALVDVLRRRGEGPSEPTPNLPALIAELPGDDTRAPQTQFTRELQAAFLETLAVIGSVRGAARRVRISHQSVYRARRGDAAFGRAWDAAMTISRPRAEERLAHCALEGFQEEVWYHGEHVGTRTRFSERLLLAHLGRLDKLRTDARIEALAEDFDAMLGRMRAGGPIEAEPAATHSGHAEPVEAGSPGTATLRHAQGERRGDGTPDISSNGRCNTRSMSPANEPGPVAAEEPAEPPCDCAGVVHGTNRGQPHYRRGADGPEPVLNIDGSGPCCDDPRWPECRDCPHYPPVSRLLNAMDDARPADAPATRDLGDREAVEACQMEAFDAGDEDWWRMGADYVLWEADGHGGWRPEGGSARGDDFEDDDWDGLGAGG